MRPPSRGMDGEEANIEKNPVVSQRAGSWGPKRRKKKSQGTDDKELVTKTGVHRRKFVHTGRTSTMSATVRGALARGTDLSTAPCYIKLTLSSRTHGDTRRCRVTK